MLNKEKKLISIRDLTKIYKNNFCALKKINLDINEGEIFALLGPNGAGKSTLINVLCSLTHHTSGQVDVAGMKLSTNRKKIKSMIGLVPQELHLEAFETVIDNINYSRGLWGKRQNNKYILDLLKKLNLYDKRKSLLMQLSGGMKRRVLIAKALSHEPNILFLDEPSAGVDIELRKDMWQLIYSLKEKGVTIILTTHYIEEAEEIADRVGFINNGKIILVEEKKALLNKLGNNKLVLTFEKLLKNKIPDFLKSYSHKVNIEKKAIEILLSKEKSEVSDILLMLKENNVSFLDFTIEKRSLESIFIDSIKKYKK
jgi:ABC-2 type transport system ATP-binding protein